MTNPEVRNMNSVIKIDRVSRHYRNRVALEDVSLAVTEGKVFGLVGVNGAGKTTLIKHILGLLRPQTGTVSVFGMDPVVDPAGVLGQIGFVSEDRDLPHWMRVEELMRYSRAFYPKWDNAYAEELRDGFQLDRQALVKNLSRGELAKAGLLVALAHRPALLVLDEPSSGLDPIVRREMLEAIVRTVADEGRTVLFSSHLLDEIERVSDQIAMMANGRVVLQGTLPEILESHHRLVLRFDRPLATPPTLKGALRICGDGMEWTVVCNGTRADVITSASRQGGRLVAEEAATLDDIFLARVTSNLPDQKVA